MPARRRLLGAGLLGAGALILLAAAWVAVTGMMARSALTDARHDLDRLRTALTGDDDAQARSALRDLAGHARRAHDLTTGPAWAVAAQVPAGGEALRSVRGVTAAVDDLAHVSLPALVDARRSLEPGTLRDAQGRVDVARIAASAPGLARADRDLDTQVARLADLPRDTWLGPVDDARRELAGQVGGLAANTRTAALAARVAPQLLGTRSTQRYFVAFENEAELRGTGGLPGSFGILTARDGRLRFERFASDGVLDGVSAAVRPAPDYDRLYAAAAPTRSYVNSNVSPHFPSAAAIWTSMWQRHTGEHLTGAIAVDPTALSYLLAVTGPATLPDGATVGAGNVVDLVQRQAYVTYPDRTARQRYLVRVAEAVDRRIVAPTGGSTRALLTAAARAAGERRLLLWSSDPRVEAALSTTPLAGTVPRTARPYAGLSIVNDGGDKLDYYLDRRVGWARCGRDVTVTIALHNGAPAGLPATITARSDERPGRVRPGDNRLEVAWFATAGAGLRSVQVDGAAGTANTGTERGHPVFTVDLELPRGATRTVVLHLREPASRARPLEVRQPGVRPLIVDVRSASCR